MLKQRVITALIAAPTIIAAIFLLPLGAFAAVFLVLAGFGVLEWANLADIRSNAAKGVYLVVYALIGYALLNAPALWPTVLKCVVAFWALAAVVVLTFRRADRCWFVPCSFPRAMSRSSAPGSHWWRCSSPAVRG
jgi:phosphatidate cytidylyltransferase